jgi:hypothetical protein
MRYFRDFGVTIVPMRLQSKPSTKLYVSTREFYVYSPVMIQDIEVYNKNVDRTIKLG